MSNGQSNTSRLLKLKRSLTRRHWAETANADAPCSAEPASSVEEEPTAIAGPTVDLAQEVTCISCGYSQRGQPVDRCPECGLKYASMFRDPTLWSGGTTGLLGWAQTARYIWLWNRRLRVRTSLVPVTSASAAFARLSIRGSALLAGVGLAVWNWNAAGAMPAGMVHLLLFALLGVVLAAGFLLAAQQALMLVLRGTWRGGLPFVPASVHYATAWWPIMALFCLLSAWIHAIDGHGATLVLGLLLGLTCAVGSLWLWASVTECQHLRLVAPRILLVTTGMTVAGCILLFLLPVVGSAIMRQWRAATIAPASGTAYALQIDLGGANNMIAGQVATGLTSLGISPANQVALSGPDLTLDQVRAAIGKLTAQAGPRDRVVLLY